MLAPPPWMIAVAVTAFLVMAFGSWLGRGWFIASASEYAATRYAATEEREPLRHAGDAFPLNVSVRFCMNPSIRDITSERNVARAPARSIVSAGS